MAYKQELWDEAKKKCRIGDEEIHMAKEIQKRQKDWQRCYVHFTSKYNRLTTNFYCEEEKIAQPVWQTGWAIVC